MRPFDNHRKHAHKALCNILGEDATWTPGVGDPLTDKVLLREPTEKDIENGVTFTPFSYFIRWQEPKFPGLFESVRNGDRPTLIINGSTYKLQSAEAVLGKAFEAHAQKIT